MGSNKGEFIWEILQQSCENYINNDNNAAVRLLFEKDDIALSGTKFSYSYIDVEKLIMDNLDKRIKKLTANMQHVTDGYNNGNSLLQPENIIIKGNIDTSPLISIDSPDLFMTQNSKRRKSSVNEELKTQLLLYSNIVTNSWVLGLIKKEIDENNGGPYEKIFIINIVPNRITLFKNCLFLRQSPSFANFNFNYIAINLVKNASKRKDLEIKTDEHFDEINNNFINYFRLVPKLNRLFHEVDILFRCRVINKVIDIRVENVHLKYNFRLTASKNAIKIENKDDLISFIYMPKKDLLELNIFSFKFDDFVKVLSYCNKSTLIFVIDKQVELDDNVTLKLEEKNIDLIHVRKFIQLYRLIRYSLLFV